MGNGRISENSKYIKYINISFFSKGAKSKKWIRIIGLQKASQRELIDNCACSW